MFSALAGFFLGVGVGIAVLALCNAARCGDEQPKPGIKPHESSGDDQNITGPYVTSTGMELLKTLTDDQLNGLDLKRYQLVPDAIEDLAKNNDFLCRNNLHKKHNICAEKNCELGADCTTCTCDWLERGNQ